MMCKLLIFVWMQTKSSNLNHQGICLQWSHETKVKTCLDPFSMLSFDDLGI